MASITDNEFLYASTKIYNAREDRTAIDVELENNGILVQNMIASNTYTPPIYLILKDSLLWLARTYKPNGLTFIMDLGNGTGGTQRLYDNYGKSTVIAFFFSGPLRLIDLGHEEHLSFDFKDSFVEIDVNDLISKIRTCDNIRLTHNMYEPQPGLETFQSPETLSVLKRLISAIKDEAGQKTLGLDLWLQGGLSNGEKNTLHQYCQSISGEGYSFDAANEESSIIVNIGAVTFLQNMQQVRISTAEDMEIEITVTPLAGRTRYDNQAPVRNITFGERGG